MSLLLLPHFGCAHVNMMFASTFYGCFCFRIDCCCHGSGTAVRMWNILLCFLTLFSLVPLFTRLSLRTHSTLVALGTCHKQIAQHGQHISLAQGTSNNKLFSYFCMMISQNYCVEGTCKPLGASAVCAQLAHCTPNSQARYSGNQTHQAIIV